MTSCRLVNVLHWNASQVRVRCPYCDDTHGHALPPGSRRPDCSPGGDYEFSYPIDEDTGLVGYEIDKKGARFVNVEYLIELEKRPDDIRTYDLADHLLMLGLGGPEEISSWKSFEDAVEMWTDPDDTSDSPFTQRLMDRAVSDCLLGDIVATKRYLATTKEKGIFIKGRSEDDKWDTLLIMKARDPQPAMVSLLIEHGAEVDAVNCQGRSALMEAALWGRLKNVKILLAADAARQKKDHEGRCAFDLAQPTKVNEQERYRKCSRAAGENVPEWDLRRRHICTLLDTSNAVRQKFVAPLSYRMRQDYAFTKSETDRTITLRGPLTKLEVRQISKTAAILDRGEPFARMIGTSGWGMDSLPINIPNQPSWIDQVFDVASMVDHCLPDSDYDQGRDGQYYASHTEKKLIACFINKHVFTPRDLQHNPGLHRELQGVAELLENTKATSRPWGDMCALEQDISQLRSNLIDAQDELYEIDDAAKNYERQELIREMRARLDDMDKSRRDLERKVPVVKMRALQKQQRLLEDQQRAEEQLMELYENRPKATLRHVVIWSSNKICPDCERFKDAVNRAFDLEIELTWM